MVVVDQRPHLIIKLVCSHDKAFLSLSFPSHTIIGEGGDDGSGNEASNGGVSLPHIDNHTTITL